jgi:hypothetical protein
MGSVKQQQEWIRRVQLAGGWPIYDYELNDEGTIEANAKSPVPVWLLSEFGYDHFHSVAGVILTFRREGFTRRDDQRDSIELLSQLQGNRRLEAMYFNMPATDQAMERVSHFKGLRWLYVFDGSDVSDLGIAQVARLSKLECLSLPSPKLTDESLQLVSGLPRLRCLNLQGGQFTDDGLQQIRTMTQVRELWIGCGQNKLTDSGLVHLSDLSNLEILDLQHSQVTDNGLRHLQHLSNLKELWLNNTPVRDVRSLSKELPGCTIEIRDDFGSYASHRRFLSPNVFTLARLQE